MRKIVVTNEPVIYFEFADPYDGPNGGVGVTLIALIMGPDGEVGSKIVGHLRPQDIKASKSLRAALRHAEKSYAQRSRNAS